VVQEVRMRFSVVSILFLISFAARSPLQADEYAWPLDAPPALTSTYAEYRSGRFHAGLDVKTWGKEGYTCVAVAAGYVWRVRTSPWGYGKAVYLKLADGRTAVYAHLSGFVEQIEEVVAAEQDRRGAYSVNLFLPPGTIPVRRGDPVAFSGSTGSGYPHLHFEIRDKRQRPLNPLVNGFPVKDTTDPTLVEVAFLPLAPDSRIDGYGGAAFRPLRWVEGKGFVGAPAYLWGRIGVAVKVFDRADASLLTNKLAPYRLTMMVDGETIFTTKYDAFGYDQVYEVDLDRNFVLTRQGKKGFHNLYVARGNTLPLYDGLPIGAGVLRAGGDAAGPGSAMAAGPHTLQIVAEDVSGNRSSSTIDFTVQQAVTVVGLAAGSLEDERFLEGRFSKSVLSPRSLIVEMSADGSGGWQWIKTARVSGETFRIGLGASEGAYYRVRMEDGPAAICLSTDVEVRGSAKLDVSTSTRGGRVIVKIGSDRPLIGPPELEGLPAQALDLLARSSKRYEVVAPAPIGTTALRIQTVDIDGMAGDTTVVLKVDPVGPSGGNLTSKDGVATAVFGEAALYHAITGGIERAEISTDVQPPIGNAYHFSPDSVPFREMVGVHFKIPEDTDPSGLGVYELTSKGWSFVWNDVDTTRNTIWAGVRHFSTYALIEDKRPPEVSIQSPRDGSRTSALPEIQVALRDSLSGIPMESLISFELDGKTMIFEYDPEGDTAAGLLRGSLSTGKHELVVKVQDTNRNESVAICRFEVVP
jgi:hypothetical protein